MTKPFIITIFVLMISYVILENIVEIPKLLNNIFYGIITLLAIYFLIFKMEIGKEIGKRFREKLDKTFSQNESKN